MVGPCAGRARTTGGVSGSTAARPPPKKTRALAGVDPSAPPAPANIDVGKLKGIPHLIVWGDYRDKVAVWQKLPIAPTKYRDALVAAGGKADVFDLPAMGVKGNTHMMMMDRNSDDVAKLVHDWIAKQGLVN